MHGPISPSVSAYGPHVPVPADRGDDEDHRERVHRDALVPAQLAGRQVRALRQVERADHRGRRDDGRDREAVRTERSRAICAHVSVARTDAASSARPHSASVAMFAPTVRTTKKLIHGSSVMPARPAALHEQSAHVPTRSSRWCAVRKPTLRAACATAASTDRSMLSDAGRSSTRPQFASRPGGDGAR